jgi:hypothetical protein
MRMVLMAPNTIVIVLLEIFLLAPQISIVAADDASQPTYYVSIVMASRVDDLRGDSVSRLRNSIEFLQYLCAHHNVSAEVIIVEWNPFRHQQTLSDALRPAVNASSPIPVRIITVSPDLHATVESGTGETFFEFLAKNAGARRARGEFILITNGDIVLNDAVFRALALRRLDADAYFRVPRVELGMAFDVAEPFEARREPPILMQRPGNSLHGKSMFSGGIDVLRGNRWSQMLESHFLSFRSAAAPRERRPRFASRA